MAVVEIWTPEDLDNVRNNLSGNYIQMANIDLSGYPNWEPIGSNGDEFAGSYDGGNFNIINLKIDDSGNENGYQGLFGSVGTAYGLMNINILNADVKYYGTSGILVGDMWSGEITNCHVSGSIKVSSYGDIGGIVGSFWSGEVEGVQMSHSSSDIEVIFDDPSGYNDNTENIGGIVGTMGSNKSLATSIILTIEKCFSKFKFSHATSTSDQSDNVGGLVGQASIRADSINSININESYCISYISDVTEGSGLFIGEAKDEGKVSITKCYCTGTFNGAAGTDLYATVKSDAEMKTQGTFVGWDFLTVWKITPTINDGYPCFIWQVPSATLKNIIGWFVITETGIKQATNAYIITESGLKEITGSGIIV